MSARRARGFTLIEALLALAIFGVIAVLAYRATSSLSDGEARLSAEAQRWRSLETLFTRIEADFRQAIPRSCTGRRRAGARMDGHGQRRQERGRIHPRRIGVRRRAGPRRSAHRLSLARRDARARVLAALDHSADASPVVFPLVSGLAAFPLEYLTRDGSWRDRWPVLGDDDLPRAVRLTLTTDDGMQIDRLFALR